MWSLSEIWIIYFKSPVHLVNRFKTNYKAYRPKLTEHIKQMNASIFITCLWMHICQIIISNDWKVICFDVWSAIISYSHMTNLSVIVCHSPYEIKTVDTLLNINKTHTERIAVIELVDRYCENYSHNSLQVMFIYFVLIYFFCSYSYRYTFGHVVL